MDPAARYQETLRRLAIFDEELITAGFGLDLARTSALDLKTAALLQLAASVAIGSSAACLEWSAGRALAAGATKDEIADVLVAIGPVAGIGRVVSAAPWWRPRSSMISRPRWGNRTVTERLFARASQFVFSSATTWCGVRSGSGRTG